jgi:hypothetical protein
MRLPNGWGATETGVYLHYLKFWARPFKWFSA